MASKDVKKGKSKYALFELFSLGASTNRDEWVYDYSKESLQDKAKFLSKYISTFSLQNKLYGETIKWSRNLKRRIESGKKDNYSLPKIKEANYRPFIKLYIYDSELFIDEISSIREIFSKENISFATMGISTDKPFTILSTDKFTDLNYLSPAANGCRVFSLYRYTSKGDRKENITDWGLEQFKTNYNDKKIKKEDIFHYVYGVLHNPAYRKKYELNLKREFPRIPFYLDFWKWAKWGKELMNLHINYEEEKLFPVKRIDIKAVEKKPKQKEFFPKVKEPEPMFGIKPKIKVKLKADKTTGTIEIDDITTLKGIPKEVWDYKLGNRSAIEWILDQYKEKKPKDPTIAEKFNSYRFADHKEEVIELIRKVTTVSMETMAIINRMGNEKE
jgi:predicted helicase